MYLRPQGCDTLSAWIRTQHSRPARHRASAYLATCISGHAAAPRPAPTQPFICFQFDTWRPARDWLMQPTEFPLSTSQHVVCPSFLAPHLRRPGCNHQPEPSCTTPSPFADAFRGPAQGVEVSQQPPPPPFLTFDFISATAHERISTPLDHHWDYGHLINGSCLYFFPSLFFFCLSDDIDIKCYDISAHLGTIRKGFHHCTTMSIWATGVI
jgi:hypothetical protein